MSKLDDVKQQQRSNRSMRRSHAAIFLVFAALLFGCMYALFHYVKVSDTVVSILNVVGVVLVPFVYYIFYVKRSGGKIELIYMIFIAAIGVTYLLTPVEQKGFLRALLHWLVPLIELAAVFYIVYRVYSIMKNYKLAKRHNEAQPLEIMRNVLSPMLGSGALLEIVMTELSVFYYSIGISFRKPALPEYGCFTYHKQSQIKPIIIVFIVIIILETVGLHFLVSIWSDILAWIMTAINAYGIVYMIAFKNSFRFLPILLDDNHLRIRLGFQCDINIPLHNIESIGTAKEIGIGEKIPKDVYMAYLRFDTPQFQIRLKEPVAVKGAFGLSKQISLVIIRVDEPQLFTTQLNQLRKVL